MSLQRLRSEVDGIDRDLARLLNKRIRLAIRIGALKVRNGQKIFDAGRERSLLRRLISRNRGPLRNSELSDIYRVILRTSRQHQRRVKKA
jgi:chorismate mutase / prephenate dehydratase